MMRNYNQLGPGPSSSQSSNSIPMPSSHSQQMPMMSGPSMQGYPPSDPPVNLASKVAEVFLTAGHAFQKLGDLTLQLHSTVDPDECKWTEKEVDQLRDSLTRFAHELDMISQSVQGRTTKHIKTDIKRRHLMNDDPRRPGSPGIKRQMAMPGGIQKRIPVGPSTTKTIPVGRTVIPMQQQGQRIGLTSSISSAPLLNEPNHHFMNPNGYQ